MTSGLHRRLAVVLAAVPALLCLLRLAGLWDCATACSGGGWYERVAGIPVLVLATPIYAVWSWLIWRDVRRGAWSGTTVFAAWMLLGVSLFFVSVLVRLGLWCPHCIAVHATVVLLTSLLVPSAIAWRSRLLAAACGFLLVNVVFHHGPVQDVMDPDRLPVPPAPVVAPTPPAIATPAASDILLARIESNRSLGAATAPWRLDVAIDLYCPHCAEEHAGLMKTLAPLAGDRLRIVTRQVVRPSAPRGAELARYALAAAAIDRSGFDAVVAVLLGTRPELGWPAIRSRVAEVLDVAAIEAQERRHRDVLTALVKQDLRELRERGIGATTPALALVQVADGRTARRWEGPLDVPALTAEVERLIAP